MGLSASPASYADIRQALDRAVAAPKGIRVTLPTSGAAVQFIQRCYKFRQVDRKANSAIYAEGDPQHGVSIYDGLIFTRAEAEVSITTRSVDDFKIEEIEE